MCLLFLVAALITKKPSSVIAEEGEKVTLVCKVSGLPIPTIKWQKPLGHLPRGRTAVIDGNMTILSVTKKDTGAYVCSVKNLPGEDSALAVITVIDRLKFTLTPPLKVAASEFNNLMLNCKAQGALEITWKRTNKYLPRTHVIFPNGTLFLKKVTTNDAGSYTCVAKNYQRTIMASSTVEVRWRSCSSIISGRSGSSSGNYIIDPDGKGGVAPFSVYCDMTDKLARQLSVTTARVELMLPISLGVVRFLDVTEKMYLTLELAQLSWQHSLESHRTVNSLSSLSVIMM